MCQIGCIHEHSISGNCRYHGPCQRESDSALAHAAVSQWLCPECQRNGHDFYLRLRDYGLHFCTSCDKEWQDDELARDYAALLTEHADDSQALENRALKAESELRTLRARLRGMAEKLTEVAA